MAKGRTIELSSSGCHWSSDLWKDYPLRPSAAAPGSASGPPCAMNQSTTADSTTLPAVSTTSTGTVAEPRPRDASSADHRATSSGATAARAHTRPDAGLRNLDSSRRTTGTSPTLVPRCRTRKAPDPASATATRALAWTVPRWLVYCGPSGRPTRRSAALRC